MRARRQKALNPDAPLASSWLALRWLSLLDSFGCKSRPRNGRETARAAPVISFEAGPDGVTASVKGPAPEPYRVRISLKPLPARVFEKVVREMGAKASFAASLLSGRIPHDIEDAFAGTGRTLLPAGLEELTHTCTCGEPGLCPHLAAVHELLGERLDRDPFLIFLLRGLGRDELLKALQHQRAKAAPAAPSRHAAPAGPPPVRKEPLSDVAKRQPEAFYRPLAPAASLRTTFTPPEHPEAVLTRLGPPPLSDPEAVSLLHELHRAIGLGAAERLEAWEWRRLSGRGRSGGG